MSADFLSLGHATALSLCRKREGQGACFLCASFKVLQLPTSKCRSKRHTSEQAQTKTTRHQQNAQNPNILASANVETTNKGGIDCSKQQSATKKRKSWCLLHLKKRSQKSFDFLIRLQQRINHVYAFFRQPISPLPFIPNTLNQPVSFQTVQQRINRA